MGGGAVGTSVVRAARGSQAESERRLRLTMMRMRSGSKPTRPQAGGASDGLPEAEEDDGVALPDEPLGTLGTLLGVDAPVVPEDAAMLGTTAPVAD